MTFKEKLKIRSTGQQFWIRSTEKRFWDGVM